MIKNMNYDDDHIINKESACFGFYMYDGVSRFFLCFHGSAVHDFMILQIESESKPY